MSPHPKIQLCGNLYGSCGKAVICIRYEKQLPTLVLLSREITARGCPNSCKNKSKYLSSFPHLVLAYTSNVLTHRGTCKYFSNYFVVFTFSYKVTITLHLIEKNLSLQILFTLVQKSSLKKFSTPKHHQKIIKYLLIFKFL